METRRADMLAGLLVAVAGASLFGLTFQIRETEAGLIGASFFPRVASGVLVALGLVLIVSARRPSLGSAAEAMSPAVGSDAAEADTVASLIRVLALPAVGLAYVAAMPWIGYLLATLVGGWAALLLFGARPGRAAALALAAALAMHLLFAGAMGLFLPRGRLIDAAAWLPV